MSKLSHRWLFYHKRIRGGKVKVLARAAHVPVRGCAKRQRSRRQALSRVGLTTLHIHVGLTTLHVRMGDARSEHVSFAAADIVVCSFASDSMGQPRPRQH